MIGNRHKAAACILATVACSYPSAARAQDASAIVGTYCLVGVHEVGSCLKLTADGRFEYFLAYGAYDENSEGIWRLENGDIIVDSLAYDRPPTFAFKRFQHSDGDEFGVIVESKRGDIVSGIDVKTTCDGRTIRAGVTGAVGFKVDCMHAPVDVALGLRMYGLAYQTIDVSKQVGADKIYVFEFDPGDLGRKKFTAHHLRFSKKDSLVMDYTNSPFRELQGRSLEFVRQPEK
jgi:hypothetical protein